VTLDHRPHRAIKNEKTLLQKGGEFGGTIWLHGGYLEKALENEKTRSASSANGFRKIFESRPL